MCKIAQGSEQFKAAYILNLHRMLFKNQRKNTPALVVMVQLMLFMFFFVQAFAGSNDSTAIILPDTLSQPVAARKDFAVNLQPNLISETSAGELRAGLVYDVTTNTIVWEKDMQYAYPIASLTKMMVALLAIEEIKATNFDWQDEIKATRTYRKSKRSRKTYTVNETYSLEGLLKLAMIPSNNEACGMIAKHMGGTVEVFVKRMNDKASQLGMSQTFYSNPSGLPASYGSLDNSSSPHDLLILATELIKYPEILSITNIAFAEVENGHGSNVYRNHNHLVMDYPNEVDGLKTGYTKNARFCLVATANKNSHRLIAIALGARGPYLRNQIVGEMLNNYYTTLGIGPMGNQKVDPLYAKVDAKTTDAIASSDIKQPFRQQIVYKTVTSIVKKPHTVKSGQTLSEIADKYEVSVNELKKWNRLKTSRILKGQKLYVQMHVKKQVPVKVNLIENYDACEDDAEDCGNEAVAAQKIVVEKPAAKTATPVAKVKAETSKLKVVYHQVQPGDTLWSIAQKYPGVSVDQLKRLNRIINSKDLKAGSKIKVSVNS